MSGVCRSCGWAIRLDFGLWADEAESVVCYWDNGEPKPHEIPDLMRRSLTAARQEKVKMKVGMIKKMLDIYEPDTDLIVAWWDKETVESYGAPTMTDDQWSVVVDEYEEGEWVFQSLAAEDFVEIAEKITKESM